MVAVVFAASYIPLFAMFPILFLLYLISTVIAVDPVVRLDYASYRGTSASKGINKWLGMRYAAPPIGALRFAAPQDPPTASGVQPADKHGLLCIATGGRNVDPATSEDCLFLDVYAPSGASTNSKLPVYFFIQGGGFNANANPNFDGSGLITASGHKMVVVNFNYRVGPYGFLASREVRDSPSAALNNGLRDQRKALEWVQKYIAQFGGDPKHVVIGGDSAGAASVALHLTANGGRDDGLFVGAAAESVSFATILTVEGSQYQYDSFANRLGCASSGNGKQISGVDSLACLRSKSAAELQSQNYNMPYPGAEQPPLFMWNPVLDAEFVQNYTYAAFDRGDFIRVPVIFGDDTNGGTIFTPRSTSTIAQSNTFMHNQFPYLTVDHLRNLNRLYPNQGPQFPNTGPFWRQLSDTYGDARYMCPNLFISSSFTRYGVRSNWNYRYNVEDPAQVSQGLGVPHVVELAAIWGPENLSHGCPSSYRPGGPNAWVVPLMQSYWVSFIRTLDPNTERAKGAPLWETFTDGSAAKVQDAVWRRMLFDTKDTTAVETVSTAVRARCQYICGIGTAICQ